MMRRLIRLSKPVILFPDAVLVAIQYLRPNITAAVYSRVPNPRPAEFVRIQRLGGTRRSLILDRPRIDVECWSDSEENAEALCSKVRAYVLAMAGKRGQTTVYDVAEVSGPMWLPDSESGQPRYSFAVEFSTRGTRLETT
ncbi:tail terminator [Streptomyces phage Rowa]|uniref:Head-to-tail connector complex protein n=1 Tax=Streptomyces phage Rowa TaxID=2059883 RepID=A0A2H5BLS0_9CAUD|nr:tail terminator [Streptomyces phage Rowa]AUG87276.1 head-to-tail connector complex protein [Streptomyces phage Rowa]